MTTGATKLLCETLRNPSLVLSYENRCLIADQIEDANDRLDKILKQCLALEDKLNGNN